MTLTTTDFGFIQDLVRKRSAIVLDSGKEYLVEARLLPVARQSGTDGLPGLVAKLRSGDPRLVDAVVDAMTTNETSWFRDNLPFEAFTSVVVPELVAARTDRRLSIWSAACSSGQEPYSLAMLLRDALAAKPGWTARILATDLSEEMCTRTRAATYSQLEVNRGLPAPVLVRNFERSGTGWQVKPDLRSMVEVRRMNLDAPFPPMGPFDVVFLRNVLIYFDPATKRQVLERVRRVLRPDGYLFLGSAETTLNLDDAFERVTIAKATAYRLRGGKS